MPEYGFITPILRFFSANREAERKSQFYKLKYIEIFLSNVIMKPI